MYSFEGDYRRKPQQKLGGASIVLERDELISKARQQRQEREQQRKRYQSVLLLQACARGFTNRRRERRKQRSDYDNLLKEFNRKKIPLNVLSMATKKLLFFYEGRIDKPRLQQLSHIILLEYGTVLEEALTPSNPWNWRVRRLLALNVKFFADKKEPLSVSLRLLEIFTCLSTVREKVGRDRAVTWVTSILSYLINNSDYFVMLRSALVDRTPPLLAASSRPPTPLAESLFRLIISPLELINHIPVADFRTLTSFLFLQVFSPKITEVIQLYVIPAMCDLPFFPFSHVIEAIHDMDSSYHSCSLLYTVLQLERKYFTPSGTTGLKDLIHYLHVVSSLSNFWQLLTPQDVNEDEDEVEDEIELDADTKHSKEVLEECIKLLNDESRVNALLTAIDESYDPQSLNALCQICHCLLLSNRSAVHNCRLLYMLAFKPLFLKHLWDKILIESQTSITGCATPLVQLIARGSPLSNDETRRVVHLLAVFCSMFTLFLTTLHDSEFYGEQTGGLPNIINSHKNPFSLQELIVMTRILKDVSLGLVNLAFPESRPVVNDAHSAVISAIPQSHTQFWSHLFKAVVQLLRQLHARDCLRPFCPEGHWVSRQVQLILGVCHPADLAVRKGRLRGYRPFQGLRAFTREDMEVEGPPLTTKEVRTATLLQELPFLVPFEERVWIFQMIVMSDKSELQGEASAFLHGPSIQISVRRNYLYEDAFEKLSSDNEPEMRLKMRVKLINSVGLNEAGVDGGGVFREFLTELLKTAFDPNRGFFKLTNDNLLYPNPRAELIVENYAEHYFFIGRLLGKALYENLLVELPLAEFFLKKLVAKRADVDIHHLESLDPVLYKNLLFLKNYEGDVQDLGLDFTVVTEELGERNTEELKPNGAITPVTSSNRIEYIHLVADYKLNRQIRGQCAAFRAGFTQVIPLEWVQMFNSKELKVLIAGAEVPVDVTDLRANTQYAGGYSENHPTILTFWKVVSTFTDMQKRQLLRFVTSCSRPPLLGFKELCPPFCIQNAGAANRLPTASTCMNLLKLPEFPNESQLCEKLMYAITAGAGFELS